MLKADHFYACIKIEETGERFPCGGHEDGDLAVDCMLRLQDDKRDDEVVGLIEVINPMESDNEPDDTLCRFYSLPREGVA